MAEEKQGKRVKVTSGATHQTGVKRAAVKPHKRVTEPNTKQLILDYMNGLKPGSTTQTYWGEAVDKAADALRKIYGLAANDDPYLVLDLTGKGTAQSGMTLSTSGIHICDGRGGSMAITWKELAGLAIAFQRNMLVIGQTGINSRDSQVLTGLLQHVQAKLAK
ncbi:MAG: hypothetical protein Q4D48_03355 [Coriobacteriales bacterium]|jgi:hypothetical protein|nr:hypothetical protein [Coriobacteriales bacterium]